MAGKNNLRVQIEQLFRDNPRKSFGVSEIARQLNARRNTIHYHLKALKAKDFLGQDSDGTYYLALNEGEEGKSKIGMINRSMSQNQPSWCVKKRQGARMGFRALDDLGER
jgi:hypothetical protein